MSNEKPISGAEKKLSSTIQAYSIFNTKKGRAVLTDLAKECGLFTPSDSLDPAVLAYKEGQRAILHKLLALSEMNISKLHDLFMDDYRENIKEGEDYE